MGGGDEDSNEGEALDEGAAVEGVKQLFEALEHTRRWNTP